MRLGFLLGVLIGGGIAVLMSRMQEQQAGTEGGAAAGNIHPLVDKIKHQFEEAREAAREAQLRKEAELQRMFDDLVSRKEDSDKRP